MTKNREEINARMSSIQKRVLLMIGAALVLSTFVIGCGRSTVAAVNGRKITRKEYYDRLERLPYTDPQTKQSVEAGVLVLQRLISEEMILRLAEKEGVAPTDQQIKDRIAQSSKQPGFAQNMQNSGITKDQFRELMRVEQAAFNLQTKGAKVPPAQVRAFYDKNRATVFTIPEQVQLAGIFVNSKAEADNAMTMLKKEVAFGTVAQALSKHPSAKTGGRLSPLARGDKGVPEYVQKPIFSTPRNKWTAPISDGRGGFVIFQVLQHLPQRTRAFKDVESMIRDRMMLEQGVQKNADLDEKMTKFREAAKIDVSIERYKKILVPEKPKAVTKTTKTGKK